MGDVGELGELGGPHVDLGARGGDRAVPLAPGRLGGVALGRRAPQRLVEHDERPGGTVAHGLGDGGLPRPGALALGGTLAGDALGPGGALERLGAAGQRPRPLLAGAQGQPRLGLAGPRTGGQLGQPVAPGAALDDRRLALGGLDLGGGEPLGELGQLGAVVLERAGGGLERLLQPRGLGVRGAGRRAEVAQLLGDGGERGVGLVEAVERRLVRRAGRRLGLGGADELEPHALGVGGRLRDARAGLVERGLQVQGAGRGGRAAGRAVAGQHVAGAGGDDQVGAGGDDRAGRGQVVDDDDVGEQGLDGRAHVLGGAHEVDRAGGAGRHVGERASAAVDAPLTSSVARPASSVRR